MTLRRTLLAVGTAILLFFGFATPALAGPGSPVAAPGKSGGGFNALLGGVCSAGYTAPVKVDNGRTILATAGIDCYSSVDSIVVSIHLARAGGPQQISPNTCSSASLWSVTCSSATACVSGYYTVHAQYQATSTSGYFDQESSIPYAYWISC
jgi:hypothetical protein